MPEVDMRSFCEWEGAVSVLDAILAILVGKHVAQPSPGSSSCPYRLLAHLIHMELHGCARVIVALV